MKLDFYAAGSNDPVRKGCGWVLIAIAVSIVGLALQTAFLLDELGPALAEYLRG